MKITGAALAVTVAALAGFVAPAGARADGEVLIRVSVPGAEATPEDTRTDDERRLGLAMDPDPLIIVREPGAGGAMWRLDAAAYGLGSTVEIRFEGDTPFAAARISGPASGAIGFERLRDPVALGTFPYAVRLLSGDGGVVATGLGRIEINEPGGIPRLAILIVCAVGVLFLISNYAERKPLTRSYEEETEH